jgi:hypothetical protein
MDEQELMITFSILSFSVLGLGSIILSLVTLQGKGNRSFAIITSLATIFLGGFMFFMLSEQGAIPTAMGVIAFVISLLPGKRSEPTNEDF